MNDRDDPVVMPSCPFCGSNERVDRDTVGAKDHKRGAYLCGACWVAFTGSQSEWAAHKDQRETRRKRQEATAGQCSTSN